MMKNNILNFASYGRNAIPAKEKFESLQYIALNIHMLSSTELKVLYQIWMRTIWWGNYDELILIRHLINGVPKAHTGPLGIKKRSLQNALKSLLEKNIIDRTPCGNGYRYWINWDWDKKTQDAASPRQKIAPGDAESCTTYKYENKKLKNKNYDNNSGKEFPQLDQDNKKKLPRSKPNRTVPELNDQWVSEVKKAYPDFPCIGWTAKECGQVKHFKNSFLKTHPGKDVWDFFQFCIKNWDRIREFNLSWSKEIDYPSYPVMGFLIGFKKYYLLAYGDKQFNERQLKFTSKEREISKLKRMGYTQEQAEEEYNAKNKNSKVVDKYVAKAEKAEYDLQVLGRRNRELEIELKMARAQRGEELLKRDRKERKKKELNPGSNVSKKPAKKDVEGFAIFEGEDL